MLEWGRKKNPTVLIVDDEPSILESLGDLLRREFHVLATSDPDQALELVAAEEISLVISDQRMPKMTGAQLLTKVANLSPDTVRVLLTAYADIDAVVQAVNDAKVSSYLSKPWRNEEILELVRNAVETHDLAVEERKLIQEVGRLQGEDDLLCLRSEVASYNKSLMSRELARIRAGLTSAHASGLPLAASHEKIPVCTSCQRAHARDATWTSLVEYLRERSSSIQDVLCDDCSARQ